MTVSRMSPDADPSGRSDFPPVSAFSALFVGDQLRIMCILEVKKTERTLRCFIKPNIFHRSMLLFLQSVFQKDLGQISLFVSSLQVRVLLLVEYTSITCSFVKKQLSKRVLHFRSGKNDCVISSGIKSCIPCRLQKCLQVFIVLLSEKKVLQNHPDRLTNSFLCIKSLNLDFVLYSKFKMFKYDPEHSFYTF